MRTRIVLLAVLVVGTSGCFGDSSTTPRISRAELVRQVGGANQGVKTHCSRHSADGSRWACLVGDGMDPECYVVDVDENGHWRIEDRPTACRFP